MPSGINQCNTTIVDDDGFYDATSPLGVIVVGDEGGYLPLKPLYEYEPFIVVTAQILSGIKTLYDEQAVLLSDIKLSHEEKANLLADIKRLYEYYERIKSNVGLKFEELAWLKSPVKHMFEENAELRGDIKYAFEENMELRSDIKCAFEEVAKLQPDLSLEEFSEWIKDLINDRKIVEIGKINKEIEMLDEQLNALQGYKLKTEERLGEISRLKKQISRLEDEKKRIKKKLRIKKILRVLKALEEI